MAGVWYHHSKKLNKDLAKVRADLQDFKDSVVGVKVAVSVGLPGLGVHDIRVVASPECPVAARVPVATMLLFWSRTVMVPDGATELLSVSTSAEIGTATPGCTLPGTKSVVSVGAGTTTTDAVPS